MPKIRCYTELSQIRDFYGRYRYLRLNSSVGLETFGFDRWINQQFYTSAQWRRARNEVIARDRGNDLGVEGYAIFDQVYVHHMNPMELSQIVHGDADLLDPEYLISVSHRTHNAIHYGDEKLLVQAFAVRRPGDTKLW